MNTTLAKRATTSVLVMSVLTACMATKHAPGDLDLTRRGASHRYRLTTTQQSPAGETEIVVTFDLQRDQTGLERLVLLEAETRDRATGRAEPVELAEACREAFNGDAGTLGIVTLTPGDIDFGSIVPECVPELLMISVMDIVGFLIVQADPAYGLGRQILEVGDEARSKSIDTTWRRPPDVVAGRLSCPGGITRLERLEDDSAYLSWTADPITMSIVRRIGGPDGPTMLLGGTESFAMELVIDLDDGTLKSARSIYDDTEATMWMPFEGDEAPARTNWPTQGGRPVKMSRTLVLELID